MIKTGCGIFVIFLLASCAEQHDVNQLISTSNSTRLSAFSSSMAACGDNNGCLVGVSMAYAGGMGQQKFYRETTVLDWVTGIGGVVNPWIPFFFTGKKTSTGSISVGGDYYENSTRADSTYAYQSATSDLFTSGTSTATDSTHWTSEHDDGTE